MACRHCALRWTYLHMHSRNWMYVRIVSHCKVVYTGLSLYFWVIQQDGDHIVSEKSQLLFYYYNCIYFFAIILGWAFWIQAAPSEIRDRLHRFEQNAFDRNTAESLIIHAPGRNTNDRKWGSEPFSLQACGSAAALQRHPGNLNVRLGHAATSPHRFLIARQLPVPMAESLASWYSSCGVSR